MTHGLTPRSTLGAAIVAACLMSGAPSDAEERGVGPYTIGTLATLLDRAPDSPGWRGAAFGFHFEGETSPDVFYPVAGVITAGLKSEVNHAALGVLYTFEPKVFGATYTMAAYTQFIDGRVTARILTPTGFATRVDHATGPGDSFIVPAILGWTRGNFQLSAALPIRVPTGDFQADRLINTGTNAFSVDPVLGLSYLNPTTGFGASVIGGVTINGENPTTDYRSGSLLHIEGSVQQYLPLGPGHIGLGATGAWLQQITDDSGPGAFLGDFRSRALSIGPVVGYSFAFEDGRSANIEFKWLPEIDTKNRVEGDYFWLKGILKF